MNSQWFSFATLVVALVVGYGVIVSSDSDELGSARSQQILHGYYLKNAIITETSPSGEPHMRFAADELAQQPDGSLALTVVRVDYLTPADQAKGQSSQHWVVNADQALLPPRNKTLQRTEKIADRPIQLRGNVTAHSTSSEHSATLATPALDIDIQREIARTFEPATVDIDGHVVQGRGLFADLKRNHLQLNAAVSMRLAAAATTRRAAENPNDAARLPLPELWEADDFEYENNILVLTRVRSRTPPYVSADKARATGEDLTNNQWVLSGAVRVELPQQGELNADAATITVRDGRVARAQVTGTPVKFQHRLKENEPPVHGRAQTIDYDVAAQTVRFSGDAWFNNGKFEFTSEFIEYNLATGDARGKRGSGGPTRTADGPPPIPIS